MKIGLNGQRLTIDKPAGPEIYTYNLYNALARIDRNNDYVIYFEKKPEDGYFESLVNNNPKFSYKLLKKHLSWTQFSLEFELIKNPVDVFFTPIHTLPVIDLSNSKKVVMIHGLEYTYSKVHKNPLWRAIRSGKHEWFVAKFSDHIIVPSKATKDAIMRKRWEGISESKINVISEGVSALFYKRPLEEIAKVKEKLGIGQASYLVFVSTIQPRKNIPRMVEGFSKALHEFGLQHKEKADVKLVIAGKKGWLYDESLNAPKAYGVENNVLFVGRVDDQDLPALLSGAKAFISCSLEEGFGLPLLEAMACETPAIVSNIEAFGEVSQDTQIYIDPYNVNDIKNGILSLFLNPINETKIKAAKQISEKYTWESTAQETLRIFESVVKNG